MKTVSKQVKKVSKTPNTFQTRDDISGIERGMALIVNSETYYVVDICTNSTGLNTLILTIARSFRRFKKAFRQ